MVVGFDALFLQPIDWRADALNVCDDALAVLNMAEIGFIGEALYAIDPYRKFWLQCETVNESRSLHEFQLLVVGCLLFRGKRVPIH